MAGFDQVHGVVALDDAKPDGYLTAQSLGLIYECPNHSRVDRCHIAVLLGSMSSIDAVKPIDMQLQLAKGYFGLTLNVAFQRAFAFHCN
jgi:hypothetical protein